MPAAGPSAPPSPVREKAIPAAPLHQPAKGYQQGKNQQWQNQQFQHQQGKNQQQDQHLAKGQGKQGGGKGPVKNGGICLQWSQKGSCSRGANCPWKHQ